MHNNYVVIQYVFTFNSCHLQGVVAIQDLLGGIIIQKKISSIQDCYTFKQVYTCTKSSLNSRKFRVYGNIDYLMYVSKHFEYMRYQSHARIS